ITDRPWPRAIHDRRRPGCRGPVGANRGAESLHLVLRREEPLQLRPQRRVALQELLAPRRPAGIDRLQVRGQHLAQHVTAHRPPRAPWPAARALLRPAPRPRGGGGGGGGGGAASHTPPPPPPPPPPRGGGGGAFPSPPPPRGGGGGGGGGGVASLLVSRYRR